jgi:formylglycine-generating enzyme required for sulfatase activity
MLGNVWQWVSDWYDGHYYQGSRSQDPQGPASGPSRLMRGGSWHDIPRDVRVSHRGLVPPDDSLNDGFRCVGEAGSL